MEDTVLTLAKRLIAPLKSYFLSFDSTYQTGSWAPSYYGATTAGSTTYGDLGGGYTRIGRMVVATVYVNWSAATGTGQARISLPFTAVNTSGLRYAAALFVGGVTYGADTELVGLVSPNTNYVELYSTANNGALNAVNIEAAGQITATVTYFI